MRLRSKSHFRCIPCKLGTDRPFTYLRKMISFRKHPSLLSSCLGNFHWGVVLLNLVWNLTVKFLSETAPQQHSGSEIALPVTRISRAQKPRAAKGEEYCLCPLISLRLGLGCPFISPDLPLAGSQIICCRQNRGKWRKEYNAPQGT